MRHHWTEEDKYGKFRTKLEIFGQFLPPVTVPAVAMSVSVQFFRNRSNIVPICPVPMLRNGTSPDKAQFRVLFAFMGIYP